MLERRTEGDQAALSEAGNGACQHLCETLMHAFAKSLKTQHLKWLRNCAHQFGMVQDIALISARCHTRMQQAECMMLSSRPVVSKHIQAVSHPHQISSFKFARCCRAFADDRLLA